MENKVAIITGASSGIGKATAEYLSDKGYKVYGFSRRASNGIESVCVDVTDRAALFEAVKEVFAREGRIDALINNAGMGISGAVEDTDDAAVRKIFDVNFFGTLHATQAVLPYMRKTGGGTIVNVSSAAAPLSLPFQAFYSATKAAVTSLTEALRIEVKPFGIKVASVLPGDVKTDFTAKREKNKSDNPVYGERIDRSVSKMERDEQNGMPARVIAREIYKLLKSKNPPVYKVGGRSYAFLVGLAKLLPKRTVSFLIGKLYG